MPWPLYLALKQLFPSGRRFPFFTFISTAGVALGVMLLVVVTSVMGGFGHEIRRMIVETQGDVQVRSSYGRLIEDPDALMARLEQDPDVVATTPFAEGFVVVQFENRPSPANIQGISLEHVQEVVPIDRYLVIGSLDDLDDDSLILSSQLARNLGARVGDEVQVYSPLMIEKLNRDEVLLPRMLRVAGIFEVGHQELDSTVVIGTLRLMQDLYGLGPAVHGINLRLVPGADANAAALRLSRELARDGLEARSWMEMNDEFLFVLQLEKNMIFFLLVFVIVVAAFSVTSSLLISVVRKTREIGLLGALGGRPRDVALCFCAQGFFIGGVGTAVGLGLGLGAVAIRNDFVQVVMRLIQRDPEVLSRFYQFTQLPAHTSRHDLMLIVTCSLVISTLAGLLPAWRAARLRPVEALRSE